MSASNEPFWTVPRAVLAAAAAFAIAAAGVVVYPHVAQVLSTWNGGADESATYPCASQTEENGISVFCTRGDVQRAPSAPRGTIMETPKAPSAPRGTIVE